MLNHKDLDEYNISRGNSNTFFHKHFYDWQLKKLNIPYIDKSYDTMNRNSLPKNMEIPKEIIKKNDNETEYVKEAKNYVNKIFDSNYGNVEDFFYPITHKTAKKWLNNFIKKDYNFLEHIKMLL